LRAEVTDMLRDAIVSGRLKPGDRLKENVIAQQMSVSRSPIREALRQLEQEGLVVSIPNQGCFVKRFSEEDIRDIFTLRATLESLACELILMRNGRLGTEDFDHLELLLQQQLAAIDEREYDRLTALDMEFHEFFCQQSGSERLLKMWRMLRSQMGVLFSLRFRAMPDYVPSTVGTDHGAIIRAMRRGDLDDVTRLHRQINNRVCRECIEIIYAQGGDG